MSIHRKLRPIALSAVALSIAACEPDDKPPQADPASVTTAPTPTATVSAKPTHIETSRKGEPKTLSIAAAGVHKNHLGFGFVQAMAELRYRLFPFRDQPIVMRAGHAYELRDGKLVRNAKAVTTKGGAGLTPVLGAHLVRRLEGRWPDLLVAEVEFMSIGRDVARTREQQSLYVNDKWVAHKEPSFQVVAHGSSLIARNWITGGGIKVVASTDPEAKAPQSRTAGEGDNCNAGTALVTPQELDVSADGTLYALGKHCTERHLAIESWREKDELGHVTKLPLPVEPFRKLRIAAVSHDTAFVIIHGNNAPTQVLLYQKGTTLPLKLDLTGRVEASMATADGTLWLLLDQLKSYSKQRDQADRLVSITTDGHIREFIAPHHAGLEGLWARDKDTAYTVHDHEVDNIAGEGYYAYLFSTANSAGNKISPKAEESLAAAAKRSREYTPKPPPEFASDTSPDNAAAPQSPAPQQPAEPKPITTPKQATAPKPASQSNKPQHSLPAFDDSCTTPFVFLYDVNQLTGKNWEFPQTRAALSSFAQAKDIQFVDVMIEGRRRVGVVVPDEATGQALIAHVRKKMKDEDPELVCYEPQHPRVIPLLLK